ncbi:hypothetical protein [Floridanema evergladense]|uniref:Rad50/SbcC-type AAA domain-containing protein n=1 Tax=Floridaenema evergladense BLCC-F167 TaxID=3153639 RepID=A0ABV4WH87_9CYAN
MQVPDFRVLQNVDITFEKDFFPNIFPLGSQNGGGKSTLLQLIFGLLHCAGNPDRVDFLKNLLAGFKIDDRMKHIALIDIWDGEKAVTLKFLLKHNKKIITTTTEGSPGIIWNDDDNRFSSCRFTN